MKNMFKTTLIAAGVTAAMGASAATVTSTPVKLSEEGVANGYTATNQAPRLDVAVSTTHPSASVIKLEFDNTVDLNTGGDCNVAVTNLVGQGSGTASCGATMLTFNYGTGSFTFDNLSIDDNDQTKGEKDSLMFQVNLGNPLTADSAFRIDFTSANVTLMGAATVAYTGTNPSNEVIETGTGSIATLTKQFGWSIKKAWDGLINRDDLTAFIKNGDAPTPTAVDELILTLTETQGLAAELPETEVQVKLEGSFANVAGGQITNPGTPASLGAPSVAVAADSKSATITFTGVNMAATQEAAIHFTTDADNIPESSYSATVSVLDNVVEAAADVISGELDAGEWMLDATVVNVPYLPVGYGLTPNVEIANEGDEATIQLRGFDQNGMAYGPVTLSKKAAKGTVTKVSEADIQAAFGLGLTDKRKLSVTFIMDADVEDITLVPYYRQNESRINVVPDLYKDASVK